MNEKAIFMFYVCSVSKIYLYQYLSYIDINADDFIFFRNRP